MAVQDDASRSEAVQGAADSDIGPRLRHGRLTRRMTLRAVAEQAECSESLLSKVENGRASPSLSMLHRICRVLGLTVGELFSRTNAPPGVVWRAGERPILRMHPLQPQHPNNGTKVEQLIPFRPGNLLEGSIHLIAPGSRVEFITHQGEEVAYVIEGMLEMTVGVQTYIVNEGDSLYFRSELPHGSFNPGPNPARVLVINTPPTF